MIRKICILVLFLRGSQSLFLSNLVCPNEQYCKCDVPDVSCVDPDNTASLEMGIFYPEDEVLSITVRGFLNVTVHFHFLEIAQPTKILFTNITNLNISRFAFLRIGDIEEFEFSHISNLVVDSYSFYPLQNITTVKFLNVKSSYLKNDMFLVRSSQRINIDKCAFDKLDSNAFQLLNTAEVSLTNTLLGNVSEKAFVINGGETTRSSVSILNVSVETWSKSSLILESVSKVVISNCSFQTIKEEFVSGDLIETFEFSDNMVLNLELNAFRNLNTTQIVIRDNRFEHVAEDSLPLHALENNVFPCDCEMSWLWKASEQVLQNNFCVDESNTKIPLNSLSPLSDKSGACLRIGIPSQNSTSTA